MADCNAKEQAYKKLKGAQVTTPLASHSKFLFRREKVEEMEGLTVHTVGVIIEGSKHLPEAERLFTRLRKKTMVGTSDMPEEDFNQAIQERAKTISQAGFQTPLRRSNDSSDGENDNLVFRSNKDLILAKI